MSKLDEIQLLYYFGDFVLNYGYAVDNKPSIRLTLTEFMRDAIETMENTDKEELPYFEQSKSNLLDAYIYLCKFLKV